ncbi:MAG: hypothetical protein RQ745_12250 [Longimicrobiales bacterium]|nr:hypothetical protein [Longimicrobiales bacterium]
MELYDLRREETMREARSWIVMEFHPESADEIVAAMSGEHSAKLRMVLSYWDMAAAFANRGAIDAEMFRDASGELLASFCKIEPHLEGFREKTGNPEALAHTERVASEWPGATERMAAMREQFREMAAARG